MSKRERKDAMLRAHALTHRGLVREGNEDCFLSDPELGLYAVFDGMGGHNAGDVASKLARRIVHEFVLENRRSTGPRELINGALQTANHEIFCQAKANRDYQGMGTTVVACYVMGPQRVLIAHAGDSRAYHFHERRARLVTRDHTIVSELLAKGAISPEEAMRHPYKSVLSRNLGGRETTRVDMIELALAPGDRVLLCSDGLNGCAAHNTMEQLLAGAEDPERACQDLIDLALRGGGGDNITTVVIEAGDAHLPPTTQILRTAGANGWWVRREMFLAEARRLRIADSPLCLVLREDEAISIVADNFCQSMFHDLEHATGINVWTFAQNLASGWFGQGGAYTKVANLLDRLRACAEVVLDDIVASAEQHAHHTEVAVLRGLVVAELAVASCVAESTRSIEADLIAELTVVAEAPVVEHKTTPLTELARSEPPSPAVSACLNDSVKLAEGRLADNPEACKVLGTLRFSAEGVVDDADIAYAARNLYGERALTEAGVTPLLDRLDLVRRIHLECVGGEDDDPEVVAAAVRSVALCHQRLMAAVAGVLTEVCQTITDDLCRASEQSARVRAEVGRIEGELAGLERAHKARHAATAVADE